MTEYASHTIEKVNSFSSASTAVNSRSSIFPDITKREVARKQSVKDHFSRSTSSCSLYHLSEKCADRQQNSSIQTTFDVILNELCSPDNTPKVTSNVKEIAASFNDSLLNVFDALNRPGDLFLLLTPALDGPLHPVHACGAVANPQSCTEICLLNLSISRKLLRMSVVSMYAHLHV